MSIPRQAKFLLLLALFFTGLAVVSLFFVQHFERRAALALAQQTSSLLVKTMNLMRVTYSEEVVNKIRSQSPISIGPGHLGLQNRIPNPATFAIELGEKVTQSEQGLIVRLYSHYPFPNRQENGGPQDDFERDALKYLQKYPQDNFFREELMNGIETFRYAEAITMQQSCVDCHNSDPTSPKMDWRVGDVRGVLEITQPLYGSDATFAQNIRLAYLAFTGLAFISLMSMLLAVGRVYQLSKRVAVTSEKAKTLDSIAHTDELTGIPNRRAFETRAKTLVAELAESEKPLSILLFDLDRFKKINDSFGHSKGDQCLAAAARTVSLILRRADDFVARYGGEEFVVLIPYANQDQAFIVAERIRKALSSMLIGDENISLTASFGVASGHLKNKQDFDLILKRADTALYHAKEKGRNQSVIYQEFWDES